MCSKIINPIDGNEPEMLSKVSECTRVRMRISDTEKLYFIVRDDKALCSQVAFLH